MVKHLCIRKKNNKQKHQQQPSGTFEFWQFRLDVFGNVSSWMEERYKLMFYISTVWLCWFYYAVSSDCSSTDIKELVKEIDAKSKHRWSMEENSFCLSETLHHFPSQNATTQPDRLPPRLCLDTVAFVNPKPRLEVNSDKQSFVKMLPYEWKRLSGRISRQSKSSCLVLQSQLLLRTSRRFSIISNTTYFQIGIPKQNRIP